MLSINGDKLEKYISTVVDAVYALKNFKISPFINMILSKRERNIFIYGVGRSGYIGRCFTMRLMHLGFNAYFIGDSCPSVNKNDLLILISGSGKSEPVNTILKNGIKKFGNNIDIAYITYNKYILNYLNDEYGINIKNTNKNNKNNINNNKNYNNYNKNSTNKINNTNSNILTIILNLPDYDRNIFPMGTLFEITLMVFLDLTISELMKKLNKSENDIKRKHFNLW